MKRYMILTAGLLLVLSCGKAIPKVQEVPKPQKLAMLSAEGPLGPFPQTVVLSSWGGQETDKIFPPGEDWEDNIWTRGLKETLNIEFDWLWWAPTTEFLQKFNTSLAGGELPEFLSRIPYDVYLRLTGPAQAVEHVV